jgi:hypothetical protein
MAWSKPVWIDGMKFDSGKEGARYLELKLLQFAGAISDLEVQPKFVLQEGFKDPFTGERVQAITWKADFRYVENGVVIVEDVKGTTRRGKVLQTEASKLRMKLAQYRNRSVCFKIVGM